MADVVANFRSGLCGQNSIQKALYLKCLLSHWLSTPLFPPDCTAGAVVFEAFQIDNILNSIKIG